MLVFVAGMGGPHTQAERRVVGRYELLTQIARGGMGTVYLARMRGMGGFTRDVALKLVHEHLDQEQAQIDLLEEAKIAARLRHPNAVPVLDVGEDQGSTYIVMDYVEGDSLAGLSRAAPRALGEPLPLVVALRTVLDSLAGLHAAHELMNDDGTPLGLVHRDYSPQNVLVGADGITRLTDFGIAKLRASEGTQSGVVKGKIRYMSPEQARGMTLDRRCDVWAAGVVLWELLAGRRLFTGDNDASVLLRIVSEKPPLLREVAPHVHPLLEAAVAGALQMDIALRTPSAAELRRQLSHALKEAQLTTEQEDVAVVVNRIAGPAIAERRARLAAIQRETREAAAPAARQSRPQIEAATSASGTPAPISERSSAIAGPISTSGPFYPKPIVEGETTSGHASLVSPNLGLPGGEPLYDPRAKPSKSVLALVAAACLVMVAVGATLIALSVRRSSSATANASPAVAAAAATETPSAAEPVPSPEPPQPAPATVEEPAKTAATPSAPASASSTVSFAARPHTPAQPTPLALPATAQAAQAPQAAPAALPPPRPAGADGLAASPYRKKK